MRRTRKYAQIIASVREIGMVEPLVVAIDPQTPGKYLVLDGHLRLEVLKELGEQEPSASWRPMTKPTPTTIASIGWRSSRSTR